MSHPLYLSLPLECVTLMSHPLCPVHLLSLVLMPRPGSHLVPPNHLLGRKRGLEFMTVRQHNPPSTEDGTGGVVSKVSLENHLPQVLIFTLPPRSVSGPQFLGVRSDGSLQDDFIPNTGNYDQI